MSEPDKKPMLLEAKDNLPDGLHGRIMLQIKEMEKRRHRSRLIKIASVAAAFVFVTVGCITLYQGGRAEFDFVKTESQNAANGMLDFAENDAVYGSANSESLWDMGAGSDEYDMFSPQDSVSGTVPETALGAVTEIANELHVSTVTSTVSGLFAKLEQYEGELKVIFVGEYCPDFDDYLAYVNDEIHVYSYSQDIYDYYVDSAEILSVSDVGDKIAVVVTD